MYNRTLGRFDLVGIPPAPRGIPQIEVTFDIDANGILHVAAKDLGTGKEQSIRIESSSGLSDSEIDKMKKDAELHADEDKKRKELIEAKNKADSMIYATEKSLKEHGDKLTADDKAKVDKAIEKCKEALKTDNVEQINAATEEMMTASHKLAEEIYKQTQAQQQAGGTADTGPQPGAQQTSQEQPQAENKDKGDGAVDADYEVVDDKNDK